ncbi:MAG: SpoIIE family protein phosphatase [Spirulinaceae cyanobacterium SM2_1_0]|nr:SpoIIE family protein phosphatase [Spirulinaceae cyanobacterium SM2_1_0]
MSEASPKKLKLMVVDDEPDNLDLLFRTFRRDFKVFKADGALSALETLDREGEMAVIISDQRMPVMNGTEFLSKTVERFPETIRILLTGYTDVEDLVDAINSGKVFKYITKPWNPDKLKAVVQQASDTYRVVKQRTNELRRALRREEVLNVVTSAIRESLDYQTMLQRIVQSIAENFEAACGVLWLVEGDQLATAAYIHGAEPDDQAMTPARMLAEQAIAHRCVQLQTSADAPDLALPLTAQQELLAVLYLTQTDSQSAWTPEDLALLESVAEQAALAMSQAKLYQRTQQQAEKMRAELEVARQIQRNLLRQSWGDTGSARVQATCLPAREVGGDFFEVYVHPQGDIWLTVGDVSGKGVPAALFMASALSILRRELSQEASPEPATVMKNLNRALNEDLFSTNCFITMVIARYTPSTQTIAYANAGHIYPMLWHQPTSWQVVQAGETPEPNYLKQRGVPIGILPEWKGDAGETAVQAGDVFLLTSDGITEATLRPAAGSSHEDSNPMLNQDGLWHLILQGESGFNLDKLLESFRNSTNHEQEDDQTMLALEVL